MVLQLFFHTPFVYYISKEHLLVCVDEIINQSMSKMIERMKDTRQGDHRYFLAERDTKQYVYKPAKDEKYDSVTPAMFDFTDLVQEQENVIRISVNNKKHELRGTLEPLNEKTLHNEEVKAIVTIDKVILHRMPYMKMDKGVQNQVNNYVFGALLLFALYYDTGNALHQLMGAISVPFSLLMYPGALYYKCYS